MAEKNILSRETFYYYFDGKEHSYLVEGDEEGMWTIHCDHDFFRVVNGSKTIFRASSVTEAIEELAKTHKQLADAMLEPFAKRCKESVQNHLGWRRNQRIYFHWN